MSEVKPGSLIHVEFATDDPQRTVRFLDEVFGWKFQSIPGLVYHVFTTPTGSGGAVMKASEDQPKGIVNYLLSADIEEDLRKIEKAGGKVRLGKTEIPNVGWCAFFDEPTGLGLALYQPLQPDSGPMARYR